MGAAVVKWLRGAAYSVVALQEHRLTRRQLEELAADLHRFGWELHGGAAETTEAGYTSAGTLLAWKQDLSISRFIKMPDGSSRQVAGPRLTLVELRLMDVTVILGSAYLFTNEGPQGKNLDLLRQIGTDLQGPGRPFWLAADWNMTPMSSNQLVGLASSRVPSSSSQGLTSLVLEAVAGCLTLSWYPRA